MMNKMLQTNSLRLNRMFGGSHGIPYPCGLEWFYNGSLKFETFGNGVKVFASLEEAVKYFTEKSCEAERVIGQYVTFAEGSPRNWSLYVYVGSDTSDEQYGNTDNWVLCSESFKDEFTDAVESISARKSFYESLNSQNSINEVLTIE